MINPSFAEDDGAVVAPTSLEDTVGLTPVPCPRPADWDTSLVTVEATRFCALCRTRVEVF